MATLPRVISPLAPLGERGGVELVLVSVEAWPDEVVVRMRGLPNDVTTRLAADFGESLEAWHRAGGEGTPPQQPAEWVFPLDVELKDDVGTAMRLVRQRAEVAARCSTLTTYSRRV